MKKIRVKFSGTSANKYFLEILRRNYEVEISDSPEYLFYSVQSTDYLNYNCIRIFYTPENLSPDFNICDYAIGFDYMEFGDRYLRFPIYLIDSYKSYKDDNYANDLYRAQVKHKNAKEKLAEKTLFCSFVYSNSLASPCREQMFDILSEYKMVSSGGRYRNNIGGPVDNKLEFQKKHKFVIAFENTSSPGYTTEKIVHAFSADSIPIYWGNPEIAKEFNPDSFIDCNKMGLSSHDSEKNEIIIRHIVEIIKEFDEDDARYIKMLGTPAFCDSNYVDREKDELESFLRNIIDQDYERAFRRNRYYWGERYERKQRMGLKWYLFCRKFIPFRDLLRKIFINSRKKR